MRFETLCVQHSNRRDPLTGAISTPIYHSTAYAHPGLGQSTGFDYIRTANPTRTVLEETIAAIHNGTRGLAFASGMAAIDCICRLFRPGNHVVVSEDLYGGTYRLLEHLFTPFGVSVTYVDTTDTSLLEQAVLPETVAVFMETPSNPTMKVSDIAACAAITRRHGLRLIVDNTFMTPYLQRPLDLGADIVIESATKYLSGHNDVLAGILVVRDVSLAEQLSVVQNSVGAVLGPQDCWLLLRGIKTLPLRMDRHEQNARQVAAWLAGHRLVSRVYYPGLGQHPGRSTQERQAEGYGAMISFEVQDERLIDPLLRNIRIVTFAESLGGVESLITYPVRQTHADIPQARRLRSGVTPQLLRLSVGVEHVHDIVADLDNALCAAEQEVGYIEV